MDIKRILSMVATVSLIAGPPPALASASRRLLHVTPRSDLQSLLDRAKAIRRTGGAVTIEFSGGTYFLKRPLVLDGDLSGVEDDPMILRAAPGEHPLLSGGRPLSGLHWMPVAGGVLRARISGPVFESLRDGDRRMVRARYPNLGPGVLGGTSPDATSPDRVRQWRDPAGGVIHALHPSRWGGVDQRILGKTDDGHLRLAPPVGNNRPADPSPEFRYVENIREELDAPGEWFADFKSGWLYLKPYPQQDVRRMRLVASRWEGIVEVLGRADAKAHDIRLDGLSFQDTEPTFLKTTEPLLRSDWTFYRHGAITIEHATRIAVANSDLSFLGGNAVVVSGEARRISITDNFIHDIGASGIAFVGRPSAVRSPLFEYHQSLASNDIDRTPGPKSLDYPSDSVAAGNLIHDIGQYEKQSAGVEISMAARISVLRNSIYRVPRAGINVGDGTWGGHVIADNDVFATVLETGDHGAFNAWARDRFWSSDRKAMNQRMAAEPALAFVDAAEPIVLRHNRFECDRGWDIDLDDGATNYIIEDNVLLSGGLKLREGFRRIVRNNIILNNGIHPHVWFADSGDVIEHNVMTSGYQPVGMNFWGRTVDHNLFPTAAALARARENGTDAHSLAGDPSFVAPTRGDYRVPSMSPATAIGFHSFDTGTFGVTAPRLRSQAETPRFPILIPLDAGIARPQHLLGMTVKSIETLGEQSATGLPDRAGVLVIAVAKGSPADRAGIAAGDALVAVAASNGAGRQPIPTLADLIAAYRGNRWRGALTLETFHDQHELNRTLEFDSPEATQ